MPEPEPHSNTRNDSTAGLLLIVVGSHLRAEVADRPLAYRLRERMMAWLEKFAFQLDPPVLPVVCSDIWYVNQESLHARPTVCIGGPGVNALSAYFNDKLPLGVVRNEKMVIQLDPEFVDLRVSIWGMNHEQTVDAVECFCREYLDPYMKAVATQVEPREE
mgnify:CR=1 FL=1